MPDNQPLKIVHVMLSLDVGGLERNVVNQVRLAPELDQQVTVICLERPGTLAGQVQSLGGRVVCMDKPPGLCPGLIGKLAKVFRELRPAVVHSHQIASLLYGGIAARRADVPLVVHTEHGRERYAHRLRTRWLGRLAGRYARRFYCLTADMAGEIQSRRIVANDKVRVIFNGIDTAQFIRPQDTAAVRAALKIPPDAPLIGTVGRLTEVKCQDSLIRAFATVKRQLTKAHLLLVGDGPLKKPLADLAASLGVGAAVHFTGYQPQAAPYIQAMDVFVLTSRSEGMPQAALEASVAERPVVATQVGGLPELIDNGRTGLLVPFGQDAVLAEALHRILGDRDFARCLGQAARRRVQSHFDIRRMAGEYHRDYLELLAQIAMPASTLLNA